MDDGVFESRGRSEVVGCERTELSGDGVVRTRDELAAGSGIFRSNEERIASGSAGVSGSNAMLRRVIAAGPSTSDDADAGDSAASNIAMQVRAVKTHAGIRGKAAAAAVQELDESDEASGVQGMYETGRDTRYVIARFRSKEGAPEGSRKPRKGLRGKGSKKGRMAGSEAQERATRMARGRAAQANSQSAAAKATEATTKKGLAQAIASAASSLLAPLAGVLAGILAFIIGLLLVSQLISSIFGFWENEAYKANMAGLPPYITEEMVLTALECQEKYGHPAGCTLAQIICESGCGDHLSGLATRDKNLFGIKWASSFALCPEVAGCSDYQTGEYYGGQYVTVTASFTSFKSYSDCILFRSRVLLQGSRYADNPTIRRAIAECDSDLMAEGLKDAGYATSPSYVESLKSVMDTYGLRRFDGMTVKEYEEQGKDGGIIVKAAYAQLGTPYVWGGTSPYRGLDCSGLTQWCYAQAGISIPKYSEDQHACGTSIPLSQARPGDILWRPGHVAIYIGGDQYIHAPQPGDVVRIGTGIHYFTCAVRY